MGLLDPSSLPVPLLKHPPSQGTAVTDFRLYVAALPAAGTTGRVGGSGLLLALLAQDPC